MTKPLKPLFDTVFVERTCKDFKEKSVIILPDNIKDEGKRVYEGVVLYAGPGAYHEKSGIYMKSELKPGDKVMFGRYIPNTIQLDGKTVYILKEYQIYAKMS